MPPLIGPARHNRRVRPRLLLALLGCLALVACGGTAAPSAQRSPTSPLSSGPAPTGSVPISRLVYPLTGLPAPNQAAVRRTSLAVKIDNVEGAWPQAGLNDADIVFDMQAEGGLTRLMAVFQSHQAPLVGPIRSARPGDARLLRLFNGGYFAYSGASSAEIAPVFALSHAVTLSDTLHPAPYFRRSDHVAPHNLFSSTSRLYAAVRRIDPHKPGPPEVFSYATSAPAGVPTHGVRVPFPAATAQWKWNGQQYLRTQDGQPDVLISGGPISADNVVVMSVRVVGTGIFEDNGSEDPLPVTIGHGRCWVLRNGVRVAGTWQRHSISSPLRLLDGHGHVIPLKPGRTWVELMPSTQTATFAK